MGKRNKKTRAERAAAHKAHISRKSAAAMQRTRTSNVVGHQSSEQPALTEEFRSNVRTLVENNWAARLAQSAQTSIGRISKIAQGNEITPRPGELERINSAMSDILTREAA